MTAPGDVYVPDQSDQSDQSDPINQARMGYGRLLCSITSSSAGLMTTYGYKTIYKSDFTFQTLYLKSSLYQLAGNGGLCQRNPYTGNYDAVLRGYFSTNGTVYLDTDSLSNNMAYYGFIQANGGYSGTVWFYDD